MGRFGAWLLRNMRAFLGIEQIREIRIKASVLDDLCSMAQGAYPKEMLAFLSASKGVRAGVLLIDEIQLQAYHASVDSASVPLHLLPTHTNIIGTVHSHPTMSARPSDADLHLFSGFGLVHAIIGKPYTHETIKYYDKEGRRIFVRVV